MENKKEVIKMKNVTVKVSEELHKEFKKYLIMDSEFDTFQELLETYIKSLINKN